jgi:hypothetical protein
MNDDAADHEAWIAKSKKPGIPSAELKVRGVYSLFARNLSAGVWNGEAFLGLREKFGLRIDAEFPFDCGTPFATAKPVELLGMLPETIEMRAWDPVPGRPGAVTAYQPLFDYLLALPDNAEAREYIRNLPKPVGPTS